MERSAPVTIRSKTSSEIWVIQNTLCNHSGYTPQFCPPPVSPWVPCNTANGSSILNFNNKIFHLQMQFVAKFVSLVWIQRRQHKFSYPCFFHFAIRFPSAIFSCKSIINLPQLQTQIENNISGFHWRKFTHLDAKFIQLSWYGLPPVEQIIDISGLLMMDLENWPQRLCFPLALVTFSLGLSHLGFQFLGIDFLLNKVKLEHQRSGYNL